MVTSEEIRVNLTWYEMNTYFEDPMYQYMKNYSAQFLKLKKRFPTINFMGLGHMDMTSMLHKSNNTYQCHAPGKEAFVDSWISCIIFQLPFFLEKINFGYISMIFVIPILLISIFGGIKENYRWYIFNQGIWDLLCCYNFTCAPPTLATWFSSEYSKSSTCWYNSDTEIGTTFEISDIPAIAAFAIRDSIRFAPFIPLFLLSFSRFVAIFFPLLYNNKFSKNSFSIFFIIAFNIFFLFIISLRQLLPKIALAIVTVTRNKCYENNCVQYPNKTECFQKVKEQFQCFFKTENFVSDLKRSLYNIPHFITPPMFFITFICVSLIFYKLIFQLKNNKKNRKSFISTLKISIVMAFQSLTMSFIFIITVLNSYLQIQVHITDEQSHIYDLPIWLFMLYINITSVCFGIIRICLDSLIVLIVLNGYSSCLIKVFKFVILCFFKPKTAIKQIFAKNNTRIFIVSGPRNIS